MIIVGLQKKCLCFDKTYSKIKNQGNGAIVGFIGTVRKEKKLLSLKYECYKEMALKQMKILAASARRKFKVRDIVIIHRVGIIKTHEIVVIILVGASHRKEAFRAVEFLIDALKKKIPIWKKELRKHGCAWA